MTSEEMADALTREESRRRFRRTLVRVMSVQVVTLLLLWLLQRTFSS
jgi:hypothetical protein